MENRTVEVILSRRSIRKYTDRIIEEATLETLLRVGMSAPSAHDQRPWEFILVDDRKTLEAITLFHPYSKMLHNAPAAIVVCGRTSNIKSTGFWPLDCAAATMNILLAAHALGIGSVWLGVYPVEYLVSRVGALVGVPEDVTPFSIVSLGYPAEEKEPSKRYDLARVHRNRW
jgi:nitroreductase